MKRSFVLAVSFVVVGLGAALVLGGDTRAGADIQPFNKFCIGSMTLASNPNGLPDEYSGDHTFQVEVGNKIDQVHPDRDFFLDEPNVQDPVTNVLGRVFGDPPYVVEASGFGEYNGANGVNDFDGNLNAPGGVATALSGVYTVPRNAGTITWNLSCTLTDTTPSATASTTASPSPTASATATATPTPTATATPTPTPTPTPTSTPVEGTPTATPIVPCGPLDPDQDLDGVCDDEDNCQLTPNPGQEDSDGNGLGDACDTRDTDNDGLLDPIDNCRFDANSDQEDADGDRVGDICDNCPDVPNIDQADEDEDGQGDACSGACPDTDGDGVCNEFDNCDDVPNVEQFDNDGDGLGNACDQCPQTPGEDNADRDRDGFGDICDNCPDVYQFAQIDSDSDGIGDLCDPDAQDRDSDGVPDSSDNCQKHNPDQVDADEDGKGDVCDNCPLEFNPTQNDRDKDNVGDICDNCPDHHNASQDDSDGDGTGNACDGPSVRTSLGEDLFETGVAQTSVGLTTSASGFAVFGTGVGAAGPSEAILVGGAVKTTGGVILAAIGIVVRTGAGGGTGAGAAGNVVLTSAESVTGNPVNAAPPGTPLVLTGSGLNQPGLEVFFGATSAPFVIVSDAQVVTAVPYVGDSAVATEISVAAGADVTGGLPFTIQPPLPAPEPPGEFWARLVELEVAFHQFLLDWDCDAIGNTKFDEQQRDDFLQLCNFLVGTQAGAILDGFSGIAFALGQLDEDGVRLVESLLLPLAPIVDQLETQFLPAVEDFDGDGLPNVFDNCASEPNPNQVDADADGIGDICAGEPRLWGDANCDGAMNSVDALANLLAIANLNVPQQPGCPLIAAPVLVDGAPLLWADEDCSGQKNALDALLILLVVAGLPHTQPAAGCPELGEEVEIASVAAAARPVAGIRVMGLRVLP